MISIDLELLWSHLEIKLQYIISLKHNYCVTTLKSIFLTLAAQLRINKPSNLVLLGELELSLVSIR